MIKESYDNGVNAAEAELEKMAKDKKHDNHNPDYAAAAAGGAAGG
jgi:hypothetical protein